MESREDMMLWELESVAPGTPLRQALEYIIAARTGALIVMGDEHGVDALSNGGFEIDAPFTPQRLFELAKMDGAILLDAQATRVRRANVHLMPDADLPTTETGMRHRTAERVSRQTTALVISVSQRREVVSLYRGGTRLTLADIDVVLAKANQALQTLQRYRARLDEVADRLTAAELAGVVTVDDVVTVVQRVEMLLRVSREVGRYIVELGTEGRLVRLQADELNAGVEDEYLMLLRDYLPASTPRKGAGAAAKISALTLDQLLDSPVVAAALGFSATGEVGEEQVIPRGYRILHRVPLLPGTVINRLVEHFGTLPAILAATEKDLDSVEGVGARRARAVSDGLRRLRERRLP